MTYPLVIGGLALAYAVASFTWGRGDWYAAAELTAFAVAYAGGLLFGGARQLWLGYVCACCLAAAAYVVAPVVNPNVVGAVLALGLAAALTYGWPWAVVALLAGIATTEARGAACAAGVVCVVALWNRYRATGWILALLALAVAFGQRPELGASLSQRLGIWYDTLDHLTLFGSGWGSFAAAYADFPVKTNMTLLLAPHAYNDYLEILFSLGIGSVLWWAFIILCLEGGGEGKLIVLAFAILSLTYFPLFFAGPALFFALGQISRVPARRLQCSFVRCL